MNKYQKYVGLKKFHWNVTNLVVSKDGYEFCTSINISQNFEYIVGVVSEAVVRHKRF